MRRRWLVVVAGASAVVSVAIAWLIAELTDSFVVPSLPYQAGEGVAVLVFILGPAVATFFIALGAGSTRGRAAVAGVGSGVFTVALAWVTWIGLIVTYCGILGHSCFD